MSFGIIQKASGAMLIIDCTLNEEHAYEAEVTDYPTESGGTFSDNIRPKSFIYSMEGIVSNVPLPPVVFDRNTRDGAPDADAEAFLRSVFTDREPVTVHTTRGKHLNMAMQSLNIQASKDTGGSLKFSARFQQITIVTNTRTEVKRTSTRTGGGKDKRGALPLSFKEEKIVRWRKGLARSFRGTFSSGRYEGGSPIIGETEYVFYIPWDNPGRPNQLGAISGGQLRQGVRDGTWYHQDKRTQLTEDELRRFKLDMARDKKLQGVPDPQHPNRVGPWDNNGPWSRGIDYDKSEDKTRKPIDLNKTNKSAAADVNRFTHRGRNAI